MGSSYIFGIGESAQTLARHIAFPDFMVDKEHIPGESRTLMGRWIWEFSPAREKDTIYIPVSYKECNGQRESVFNRAKEFGYKIESFIHKTANVEPTSTIEEGAIIYPLVNIDPNVVIGKGLFAYSACHIGHSSFLEDFVYVTTHATICGQTFIGSRTFIGANAVIYPGVVIGRQCIIGAGALITKDLPDYSVALEGRNNIISKKSYEVELK